MRKLLIFICIFIVLTIYSGSAFATDVLYGMLHADEVESFKCNQDATIVGQIVDKEEDKFTVKVLKTISGKVKSENIEVKSDFAYQGFSEENSKPQVKDFCFLSLKDKGSYYQKAWYTVKADSGDYKTLKLLFEDVHFGGGDIPAIQWYVNSGGKEKDFYFVNTSIYVKRPNGQTVKIYEHEEKKAEPTPLVEDKKEQSLAITQEPSKSIETIQRSETDFGNKEAENRWVILVIIGIILVTVLFITLIIRSRTKHT